MAEQLLLVPAEKIIETLVSLAANEIGLLWGVKDELQRLTDTVSTIKAVLLDAEEKQVAGNHQVTDWLKKLEDAMYDADDLLDAVSTEALRREILTRDNKAKQVRIFFSKSNQLLYRLKMAPKIKAMRERLHAIDADRQRFHLKVLPVETRVWGNKGNTHSFVRAEAVIGRDDDKKAVIDRLLDSNVEDNVSILPIVAMGGLGKTTLAQLIFNDDQIKNHFELQMWVCVSDPFHVQNIVENVLEAATKKKPEPAQLMNSLVGKLKEEIDGKKYLLVLDDVWNEDHGKWSELKEVLMGGASGSRILVTTRIEIVAKISGTVQSYPLRGLEEDYSWSLFKKLAFEKGKEPEETSSIAAVGKEILKKCFGVPLAIRTIGSLLRFKNSEAEWSSFKDNELSKIPQNATDIIPTLKLSYDHLPSHLKQCFAYCSLFPKDHWFDKLGLIRLWMAQGFVKSCDDQNLCLEDVGNEYFMDLLWRSFFQEARTNEFGDIDRCKMHDLMHDFAISVAGLLITTIDDKNRNLHEKTRHVSIVDYYDIDASSITTSLCKASSIRTFLCNPTSFFTSFFTHLSTFVNFLDCEAIFSSSKFLRVLDLHDRNHELLPSSIGKLKHLRYLDLSRNENLKKLPNCITRLQNLQTLKLNSCKNLEELPSFIGELKHLRYLDLTWNENLKKLPNSMSRLQNLQTLKLLNCSNLEELPRDMKKLVNLRHLKIEGCHRLTYMPRGLGLLTNLQTLSKFVVHKDPLSQHSSGLKELEGLNNLRGYLDIENLRHGKDGASECKEAILKEKQHLRYLRLKWSTEGGVNASDVNVDDEMLLEVLQPHPNLKELWLDGNWGSRLPSWLLSLTNLVTLQLFGCEKFQYLPSLSQLPSLKHLVLHQMNAMEYISDSGDSNEFSSSFFPSLEIINLYFCNNLKGWWRRRDSSVEVNSDSDNSIENTENPLLPSFPCLLQLRIEYCPISSMPTFPHLVELTLESTSLKPLQQTMMMNMGAAQSPTSTAKASSSSTPLSKLKSLSLDSIEDLETLPEEGLKKLTSLKSLSIWKCNRLNSLSSGIQHLAALQDLKLYDCPELEVANVEDEMQWQGLKSLLSLTFSRLPKLVFLPLGLQHGTTLQKLWISDCENLTAIPEWIRNCTSLQVLEIYGCSSLTSLPEGMRSLTSLQRLKIKNCPILLQRCEREAGEDWPKIAHIPKLELQYPDSGIYRLIILC
jgi:Leucine-rich repeat (LRR) protein